MANSITALSSRYYETMQKASNILALISTLKRGKLPVSAKYSLERSLAELKSQLETLENMLK